MPRALVYSLVPGETKHKVSKTMDNFRCCENLASFLHYEVADYYCGCGNPRTYTEEVIEIIKNRRVDALVVPNLTTIAMHIEDGAVVFPQLMATGVKLYCVETGPENLFATENFECKIQSLIRCAKGLGSKEVKRARR